MISEIDVERVRNSALEKILKHELECSNRYGEIKKELAVIRVHQIRNERLLWGLVAVVVFAAMKEVWKIIGGN